MGCCCLKKQLSWQRCSGQLNGDKKPFGVAFYDKLVLCIMRETYPKLARDKESKDKSVHNQRLVIFPRFFVMARHRLFLCNTLILATTNSTGTSDRHYSISWCSCTIVVSLPDTTHTEKHAGKNELYRHLLSLKVAILAVKMPEKVENVTSGNAVKVCLQTWGRYLWCL